MGAVFHSTSSLVCNEADIKSNQRGLFYDSTQMFKHGSNTIKVSVFDEPFAVAKKNLLKGFAERVILLGKGTHRTVFWSPY